MEKESNPQPQIHQEIENPQSVAEAHAQNQEYFTPWGKIDADRTIFQQNLAERRAEMQRRREELARNPEYQGRIADAIANYLETSY